MRFYFEILLYYTRFFISKRNSEYI